MQAEDGSVCSLLAPNEKEIEQEPVVQVSFGVHLGSFWKLAHVRAGQGRFPPPPFSLPHLYRVRMRQTLSMRTMAVIQEKGWGREPLKWRSLLLGPEGIQPQSGSTKESGDTESPRRKFELLLGARSGRGCGEKTVVGRDQVRPRKSCVA